jgi:hypothetical protein
MAKSRRMSRKGSRKSKKSMKKSRKGSRKAHRKGGARRMSRKTLGLFGRVYSPVNHLFQAAENSVSSLTSGTGSIVRTGLNTVNKVGKSVTGHADQAVRNIVSRKGRKASRKSRKARKASRKH